MSVTIYHNPDCGTSRNVLGLIRNSGEEPQVIEYLKTPPTRDVLRGLIDRMGISVRDVLRRKDTPYDALGLEDPSLSDEQLLDAMMAHPILINRPIVITPHGVKLCRPSETVLDILAAPQRGAFAKEDGEKVIGPDGNRIIRPDTMSDAASDRRRGAVPAKPAMSVFERFLTFWVALCIIAGIALGQMIPGFFHMLGEATVAQVNIPVAVLVWLMIMPMLLKIDLAALGAGGTALARHCLHGRRQLAGEAVLDGVARLDLHRPSVPALAAGRSDRELHGGADSACRRALHGHGVRLVEPGGWRAAFYALAGGAQRHDHGGGVRADRGAAARPLLDHRALGHAHSFGRALHRRAGDRGAALARGAVCAGAVLHALARTLSRLGAALALCAAADARAAVRLAGRTDHAPAARDPDARGADHHPGLFQRRARLLA